MSVFVKFTLKNERKYTSYFLYQFKFDFKSCFNHDTSKSGICISEKMSFAFFNNSKLHNLVFFIPGNSIISKTEMHAAKFLFKRC